MDTETDLSELRQEFEDLIPDAVSFQCGIGWLGVLKAHMYEVRALLPETSAVRIQSVRQKYGSLRIKYVNVRSLPSSAQLALEKAILLAEARSEKTCEVCGSAGEVRDDSWLVVACDVHSKGRPAISDEGTYGVGDKRYRYDAKLDAFVAL